MLAALGVLAALLAGGCGPGAPLAAPDLRGQRLEVAAVWSGAEQQHFELVLRAFTRQTGVAVSYASAGYSVPAFLRARLAAGRLPDVAFLPQPGLLAIIAQSVPSASYLPCVRALPPGWSTSGFDASQRGTSFLLNSDRSPGRPVVVRLAAACAPGGASPSRSRAQGVVTYTRLTSIAPRFAGSLYDVFPGGCVSYAFGFALGSQIALMEQFEQAVGLYPRQQLRLVLKHELGVELGP
jgi:hypothetical protein